MPDPNESDPALPTPPLRGWRGAALVGAVATLLGLAAHFAYTAVLALRFPYGIDYGEGIVWHQMHMFMAGKAYGPIAGFPAIAYPYPPFYYVVTTLLAQASGMDELAAGRLVSIASSLAAAAFVALIAARLMPRPVPPRLRQTCAALAGLMALGTQPILEWSMLMRVDMLFVALSFAGLYLGILALTRPWLVHAAALLFVAAIFSKQIALAAPCAVFGTLLLVRPRTALAGMATGLLAALAALALVTAVTQGEFLHHLLSYTINEFRLGQALDIVNALGMHLIYFGLSLWVIRRRLAPWPGWRTRQERIALRGFLRDNPGEAGFLMAAVYLILATLLLITALKAGSMINYFLDWACLTALLASLALAELLARPVGGKAGRAGTLALALVALQSFATLWLVGADFAGKRAQAGELSVLTRLVAEARGPVISDDMVAVVRSGKPVQWEPFIFAELAKKGVWDERPLIRLIEQRHFAFFVTEGYPGDHDLYDERYNPAVSNAIRAAYPVERRLAGYTLRFPADRLPALARALP